MSGQLKAVVPDNLDLDAMKAVLEAEIRKYAPFLVKSYERTTQHWKGDKPKFTPVVKGGAGDREMVLQIRVIGSQNAKDKWRWVDRGTSPHIIRPKGSGYPLRFQSKYQAGSKPRNLFTIGASKSGPEVRTYEVHHPGNEAREWTEMIIKEHETPFYEWMRAAMGNAARASGHSIK